MYSFYFWIKLLGIVGSSKNIITHAVEPATATSAPKEAASIANFFFTHFPPFYNIYNFDTAV